MLGGASFGIDYDRKRQPFKLGTNRIKVKQHAAPFILKDDSLNNPNSRQD